MPPIDSSRATLPASPLTARKPGHAAMHEVLRRNDAFFADDLAAHWGPLAPDAEAPYAAAVGELAVGALLAKLGSGWRVLHSVPLARGAVLQHVVVGPGGVFPITTRTYPDRRIWIGDTALFAGDRRTSDLDEAGGAGLVTQQALSTKDAVRALVHPVLAVVGPRITPRTAAEHWVAAVRDRDLLGWLRSRPRVLGADQVAAIVALLSESAAWGSPLGGVDDADPTARFVSLVAAVEAASATEVERLARVATMKRRRRRATAPALGLWVAFPLLTVGVVSGVAMFEGLRLF